MSVMSEFFGEGCQTQMGHMWLINFILEHRLETKSYNTRFIEMVRESFYIRIRETHAPGYTALMNDFVDWQKASLPLNMEFELQKKYLINLKSIKNGKD